MLQRWFAELNALVLLHLPKIAAAFAATLLALYGAQVTQLFKRRIRRYAFLTRAGLFILLVGVAFGAAALLLTSAISRALLLLGRSGALPLVLAMVVGLGLLAEGRRQI